MGREWLNVFVDLSGKWAPPDTEYVQKSETVTFAGGSAHVRVFATSRSGQVLINTQDNGQIVASYGDAEVFLTINYADKTSRYLSAPLNYPIDLLKVDSIDLTILFLVGGADLASTAYRAFVNAHMIYEVL